MRRYAALAVLGTAAAVAVPVQHIHKVLTAQGDTATLPVTVDHASAECRLSDTLLADGGDQPWTATVTWEQTSDGVNWDTVESFRSAATTSTAVGLYDFRVAGLSGLRARASTLAADGGPLIVDCQPSTGAPPRLGGAAISSTATRTAIAPTLVSVSAVAATQVYPSTAGICQVWVQNEDPTKYMTCGQTAPSAAGVGMVLNPGPGAVDSAGGGTVEFTSYGGNVYCLASADGGNVAVQPTACP